MKRRIWIIGSILASICLGIGICGCTKTTEVKASTMEYEEKLFDTKEPMRINITMDSEEWETMLANAMEEEYYSCDIEIGGETFKEVGIRPKGNTSLSNVAMDSTTKRYSFKLNFSKYIKDQTCFGLDELVLNNNYADATSMKEALVYDMYHYLGADASLYNYAEIYVNGDYWGVYLAVETVEDSFLERVDGDNSGQLYKPETMEGNKGERPEGGFGERPEGFEVPEGLEMPEGFERPEGLEMPEGFERPEGGFGERPEMNSKGANLNYVDDALESYQALWDGAKTKATESDYERVVTALKNISTETDIEKYMDTDNLTKYMAVHEFSVNEDSLSGNMAHNYYLYEKDGQLNIFPWDYNLAFGGMGNHGQPKMPNEPREHKEPVEKQRENDKQVEVENQAENKMQDKPIDTKNQADDATTMVNDPIDTPFDGTKFFDALLNNETYQTQYHENLQNLVDNYILGGGFDDFYQRTREQIDELIQNDPNAFYTYEEYDKAAQTFYEVVKLRAQSIQGQLNGTIPSTNEGQRADDTALIDASSIDVSVMGTMHRDKQNKQKEPRN